jgi:hypothetical protein
MAFDDLVLWITEDASCPAVAKGANAKAKPKTAKAKASPAKPGYAPAETDCDREGRPVSHRRAERGGRRRRRGLVPGAVHRDRASAGVGAVETT